MNRRFREEQIIGILKEHEAGISAKELCRKHGMSPFRHLLRNCLPGNGCQLLQMESEVWWYALPGRQAKRCREGGVSDACRLRDLEPENAKLKKLVADLSLDKMALEDVQKKVWALKTSASR